MVPDKPAGQQEEAASRSACPSGLPRKRLLAGGGGSSPKSNIQSSDFPKKTRELPNLSECHNCGYRINTSNGKDRLQTLYSEWRIVLLCKTCFDLVESAQLCAYCFGDTTTSEESQCLRCRNCTRRVHSDCVSMYKDFSPWSYAYSDCSGFTVCVDCWIPKTIVKLRSRANPKKKKKSGKSVILLEDVVKDANCGVEKKVAAAARAREKAATKAVMARRAVELANSALDLVVLKRDEKKAKKNGDSPIVVVDDAELAFQLHRAMNSSQRIRKNLCFLNSQTMWQHCNNDDKVEEEGSCSNKTTSGDDDNSIIESHAQPCWKQEESGGGHELQHSNGNGIMHDRYLLKYSKRNSAIPGCKPKFLSQAFSLESQALAPGILLDCSKESTTFSDASFHS